MSVTVWLVLQPGITGKKVQLRHIFTRCTGCGTCAEVCPYGNITLNTHHQPVFNRANCLSCGRCGNACLQNAIRYSGESRTVTEIIDLVLRDKSYYQESGGGVTFSGGEAFMQSDGLQALLRVAKESGLHTAVETCGQVSERHIREASGLVDLFLFDIKHTDPVRLKKETGGNLRLILSNLAWLASRDPEKIILRVPVIPSFNFDEETIRTIFQLALKYHIRRVDLLPYHLLGKDKYAQLGKEYTLSHLPFLTQNDLIPLQALGEKMGLQVTL